jgi:hypothetical protein
MAAWFIGENLYDALRGDFVDIGPSEGIENGSFGGRTSGVPNLAKSIIWCGVPEFVLSPEGRSCDVLYLRKF